MKSTTVSALLAIALAASNGLWMATRGGGQPASAPGWPEADVTPGDKSIPTATAQLRPLTAGAHSASGTAGNDAANDSVTCEGEQFRSATFIAALRVEVALRLVEDGCANARYRPQADGRECPVQRIETGDVRSESPHALRPQQQPAGSC